MERSSSLGTDETGELSRDWTLRGLWITLVGFVFILVETGNPLKYFESLGDTFRGAFWKYHSGMSVEKKWSGRYEKHQLGLYCIDSNKR